MPRRQESETIKNKQLFEMSIPLVQPKPKYLHKLENMRFHPVISSDLFVYNPYPLNGGGSWNMANLHFLTPPTPPPENVNYMF